VTEADRVHVVMRREGGGYPSRRIIVRTAAAAGRVAASAERVATKCIRVPFAVTLAMQADCTCIIHVCTRISLSRIY